MRLVGKTPNKALKTDAIDSAPVAHGFAILCTTGAPLLRRLAWRWATYEIASEMIHEAH